MLTLMTLALLGCTDKDTVTGDTGATTTDTSTTDSGGTTDTVDTQDTAPPCTVAVSDTEPQADDDDVFWRDSLQIWFDGSFHEEPSPSFALTSDADGAAVGVTETWDAGEDSVVLTTAVPLDPLTAYTLAIDACGVASSVPFTTSAYGSPLDGGSESLLDRTWVLEMGKVNWSEPEGAADLLGAFFTDPLLIGVQRVDGGVIDLLVGMGVFTDLEGFNQLLGQPTWDVLDVALSDQGWFSGTADSITFSYNGVDIPVHQFALQGTFAPDGSEIAGASIEGLVDTRNISTLFNLDQEDFVCTTYAADYGLECTPCPDEELLCLDLKGQDVVLDEEPGLTLERNDDAGE